MSDGLVCDALHVFNYTQKEGYCASWLCIYLCTLWQSELYRFLQFVCAGVCVCVCVCVPGQLTP